MPKLRRVPPRASAALRECAIREPRRIDAWLDAFRWTQIWTGLRVAWRDASEGFRSARHERLRSALERYARA